MMPLKFHQYVEVSRTEMKFVGSEYQPGRTAVFTYDEEYGSDSSGPLRLVFKSSSISSEASTEAEVFTAILIYEIVKD